MACRQVGAKPLSEPMLICYQLEPHEQISAKFEPKHNKLKMSPANTIIFRSQRVISDMRDSYHYHYLLLFFMTVFFGTRTIIWLQSSQLR